MSEEKQPVFNNLWETVEYLDKNVNYDLLKETVDNASSQDAKEQIIITTLTQAIDSFSMIAMELAGSVKGMLVVKKFAESIGADYISDNLKELIENMKEEFTNFDINKLNNSLVASATLMAKDLKNRRAHEGTINVKSE